MIEEKDELELKVEELLVQESFDLNKVIQMIEELYELDFDIAAHVVLFTAKKEFSIVSKY